MKSIRGSAELAMANANNAISAIKLETLAVRGNTLNGQASWREIINFNEPIDLPKRFSRAPNNIQCLCMMAKE